MGFGVGIVFIIVALILLTGAVDLPSSVTDHVDAHLIAIILLVLGIVAVLLGLLQSRSKNGPPPQV